MRLSSGTGWVLGLTVSAFLVVGTPTVPSARVQVATRQAPVNAADPRTMGSGAISGVVVDAATNSAVAGAVVQLAIEGKGRPGSAGSMLTDAKGRFVFVNLQPSDHFTIGVTKFGYLDGGHGFAHGPGTSGGRVALRNGEWVSNVRIPLWRPAAISGMVVDERGEPAVDVYVRVIAKVHVLGHDEFASGSSGLAVTTTDERGRYRFAGLAPGQYFVEVPSGTSIAAANVANAKALGHQRVDATPSNRFQLRGRSAARGRPLSYSAGASRWKTFRVSGHVRSRVADTGRSDAD